ncbi:MAG: permease-like cell division protein FtsX [Acidimicrobiales bacterium]|nr:permease-like cell division protein FtsX [Acidimicrobiales bacterium]
MAIKLDYVIRETGTNLFRNVTLTLASVLTVVVSLTLFGSALLLQQGVENANDRFKGGIEFIVYMQPAVSAEQKASIERDLDSNPDVRSKTYVDQDETYEEFKELFRESPQLIDMVSPEILPPSFRVAPRIQDPDVVKALGDQFASKPGVREVVFAFEVVQRIQETFNKIGVRFLAAAVLLLVAALMLILNTIRVAMFARRREIEVMKLVGATNWFIRVPFIVEGIIQTLLGAAVAVGFMTFLIRPFIDELSEDKILPIFQGFTVTDGNLVFTNILVVGVAALIGAIGSAVAVSRFLDV